MVAPLVGVDPFSLALTSALEGVREDFLSEPRYVVFAVPCLLSAHAFEGVAFSHFGCGSLKPSTVPRLHTFLNTCATLA